jgi:hypothetical protein
VNEALDLTMGWMAAWDWSMPDTAGTIYFHDYSFTDKVLSVNPNATEATEAGDGVTVDIVIDADISVTSILDISGLVVTERCQVEINAIPVRYTGTVVLDIDGDTVAGTVELSHVVLASASSAATYGDIPGTPEIESCNIGMLDMIAGYLGYDITSFIDDDINAAAQELGDQIEMDLITYDIPTACGGEEPAPDPDPVSEDCDDDEIEDCDGDCAPAGWLGDGICDDGSLYPGNLDCAAHDFDDGDCDADTEPDPDPVDEGCDDGEVEDCFGDCFPESWIGDGDCDDGAESGAVFDCPEFDDDGGDCSVCTEEGDIEDCNGDCYPEEWIGDGSCDDGSMWDGVFDCYAFDYDGGDC